MPELPPLSKPWSLLPTPEVVDDMIVEHVESQNVSQQYQEKPVGTPYADRKAFPGYLLVREQAISYNRVQRVWSTQYTNQDLYNYDIGYLNESNTHLTFVRRYLIRRDQYAPLPKGSNMTGVWLIVVTNGGTGYDPNNPPAVAISGGSGSGATAQALVGSDGVVAWIRVVTEGTGYTSTPTVAIDPPLSGTQSTATATIQQSITYGVASVSILTGGADYDSAPVISFTGGGGTGATAQAQVDSGAVTSIVVIDSGSGYTTPPNVVITPVPPDTPDPVATAIATIEQYQMRLVKEDVAQLPADDPRMSLFVLVTRVYETLPGPVLTSWQWDDKLRLNVQIEKRIVWTGDVPVNLNAVTAVNGTITEYQSTENKYRTIQIVSRIPSTPPADYVFYTYAQYRFPDVIKGTPNIAVALAESGGGSISQDVGLDMDIREGYAGPCKARVTRRFTYTPNAAFLASLPALTIFNPQAHSVYTAFTLASDTQAIARITTFGIPQTLHPALTFGVVPSLPGSGDWVTPSIPATTPTNIPAAGSWIVADVNLNQYRFGLWIADIMEIQVPTLT